MEAGRHFVLAFTGTFLVMAALLAAGHAVADNTATLFAQANRAAEAGKSKEAVHLASQVLEADETFAAAFYLRAREQFRLGQIDSAVQDFDRYVELRPAHEPRQWERGIAYYYAGKFKQGASQFELYQTYHDSDVENSVWRYLCMVPTVGVERARAAMLPIENDARVPMMKIYDLYRGRLQPNDVLDAVATGDLPRDVLEGRRFHAHLYLALYYESIGSAGQAEKFLASAADEKLSSNRRINRYMWDVARIHLERLRER